MLPVSFPGWNSRMVGEKERNVQKENSIEKSQGTREAKEKKEKEKGGRITKDGILGCLEVMENPGKTALYRPGEKGNPPCPPSQDLNGFPSPPGYMSYE